MPLDLPFSTIEYSNLKRLFYLHTAGKYGNARRTAQFGISFSDRPGGSECAQDVTSQGPIR